MVLFLLIILDFSRFVKHFLQKFLGFAVVQLFLSTRKLRWLHWLMHVGKYVGSRFFVWCRRHVVVKVGMKISELVCFLLSMPKFFVNRGGQTAKGIKPLWRLNICAELQRDFNWTKINLYLDDFCWRYLLTISTVNEHQNLAEYSHFVGYDGIDSIFSEDFSVSWILLWGFRIFLT